MSSYTPEDLAQVLLSRLKIEPPIDLEFVAKSIGLTIQTVDSDNFDGVMKRIPNRARGIVAVRTGIRGQGRVRFTIAHEIGHYTQGHGKEILCRSSDIETRIDSNHHEEVEASRFASELLMPAKYVRRLIGEQSVSIATVKLVAERSRSSLTATVIQCMNVITESRAAVISVDGKVWFYKPSKTWKYVVRVGCRLDKRSMAASLDLERDMKTGCVPISVWTTIDRSGPVSSLEEQSIYLPPYNMTLSLLKPVLA